MRVVALFLLVTLLPLLPFLLWLGRRRANATRADVADALEAFLAGTLHPRDWARFLSTPLTDPELDAVRTRCARLPVELPPRRAGECCSEEGMLALREVLRELRRGSPPQDPAGR